MNKPTPASYLIGNPMSLFLCILQAIGMGWLWLAGHDVPFLLLVGSIWLAVLARNAAQKITQYKSWQQQWNAVDGPTTPKKGMNWKVVFVATLSTILWAIFQPSPDTAAVAVVFSMLSFLRLVYMGCRRILRTPRRKVEPSITLVAQCLPVPRAASAVIPYEALPDYCQRLLRPPL